MDHVNQHSQLTEEPVYHQKRNIDQHAHRRQILLCTLSLQKQIFYEELWRKIQVDNYEIHLT